MTDKVKGLVVVLDADYRIDDIQQLIGAILMLKGVQSVETKAVKPEDHMNRARIKEEYETKIRQALKELWY